jgi:hypothetical protein
MLVLALLSACGSATLTPTQEGCQDYDFNNPDPITVEAHITDGDGEIRRSSLLRPGTDQVFVPDIQPDGDVISIFEAWTSESADDAPSTCYDAVVTVEGLNKKVQVRWFAEDDTSVPTDTIEVEP